MNVYEQIVRELAESDPQIGTRCFYCFGEEHSEMVHGYKYKFVLGPDDHKPDCLWLRAKQAADGAESQDERTLHVTVNSFGDWLLEKDDGGTPTRVAVKW